VSVRSFHRDFIHRLNWFNAIFSNIVAFISLWLINNSDLFNLFLNITVGDFQDI